MFITVSKDGDIEKECPCYLYRYHEIMYSDSQGSYVTLYLEEYKIVRRTPKGAWICICTFDENNPDKFVLLTARKRYACPTIKEAQNSFLHRRTVLMRVCARIPIWLRHTLNSPVATFARKGAVICLNARPRSAVGKSGRRGEKPLNNNERTVMLTQEEKKTIAEWVGWAEIGTEDIFSGKHGTVLVKKDMSYARFDLNDAGLAVTELVKKGKWDSFVRTTYLKSPTETYNGLMCWLFTTNNGEATNFFRALAKWIEEKRKC